MSYHPDEKGDKEFVVIIALAKKYEPLGNLTGWEIVGLMGIVFWFTCRLLWS